MLFPSFAEQLANRLDAIPTFFTTTGAKAFHRLKDRLRFVAGKIVIDVDDQQRRPLPQTGFLTETRKGKYFFVP